MNDKRLEELFARYYEQTATAAETAELMELVRQAPPDHLSALILRHGEALEALSPVTRPDEAEVMLQAILGGAEPPRRRMHWQPFAAAAAILVLIAAGAVWLLREKRPPAPFTPSAAAVADIRPAREKAMLLLDDSSAIGLDTLANGRIQQHGAAFTHTNGRLVYAPGAANGPVVYNTIATGRGNFYQLVLSDGTRVWLNAASSLRFPVAFSAAERAVEVKGEAYFEVAKDAGRPFRVKMAEGMVEVLGTHFNINAYPGSDARATLLEGAVKVTRGGSSQLLQPGQQAVLAGMAGVQLHTGADLEQVMAWKAGYFWFENARLRDIMAEVARWYDVDVQFEGRISEDGYSGKITREAPLSRLLQVLELNGMHVKMKGRTIIIQQ